jgi:hypothetical protein
MSCSSRGGYTLGFCGWHESGNELRAGDLAPASCVMPGCRAPISSKDKQQIGAVFCGIRSIETQTAVNVRVHPFLAVIGTAQTSGAKRRLHVDDCDGCRQKIEAKNGLGLFV